ncbi:MAG TPA: Hpt domain-containing protein, partial [Thiobacillus sp.]
MTIDMSQFYQVFFDEADELLAEMEKLLLALDVSAPDSEDLNAIFRAAHSIKGGAATFGFTDITEVTHMLESLLDRIRKGEMALTPEHVDVFLVAKDVLTMQMDGHHRGSSVDQDAVDGVCQRLKALSQGTAPDAPAPAASPAPAPEPAKPYAAPVADADGNTRFRIELPKVPQKDVDALAAELGLLGTIGQETLADTRVVFTLTTSESQDNIVAICSFVLDPDDLKITHDKVAPAADAEKPAETAGYGIFEAAKTDAAASQPAASPAGAAASAPAEDPGYGLFEPEPAPPAASQATPPQASQPAADAPAGEAKNWGRRATDKDGSSQESSSIRVSVDKVDQLINLVGELVITQAMIEQRIAALDPLHHERLLNSASQLARNTRDLQEAVMSIRMMPMDYVFSRFPRMVRDLAAKLGKKVEFVTRGAATELDKGLIERIVDPLTHLVRNSVDHGIELPEKRRDGGKSETGKLTLSAAHQGGNIVIEVSDDGG